MSLFDTGDEAFKLAIHGAALVLVLEMATYNGIVYRRRGTGWHLFSAVVYALGAALEVIQVTRHLKPRGASCRQLGNTGS